MVIKKPLEDNVAATFDEYLAFVFERYYQDKLPFTEIATSTSTLEEKIVVGFFLSSFPNIFLNENWIFRTKVSIVIVDHVLTFLTDITSLFSLPYK